jgi:cytochrome b561
MDTANPSAARYSRGAIALHWIIALLIVTNFGLAWVAEDLPDEQRYALIGNHKAIGIIVLLLTGLRIIWRLTHKAPPLVDTLKAWEAALSKVTHALFYLLMLAIPLAGWGLSSAYGKGKPVSIFGLFNFPALPVASDKPTVGMFGELHEITTTIMLVLLALHVGAALKHHFIDKDGTVRRMVPWLK